jgi:predicted transcriptional regulator
LIAKWNNLDLAIAITQKTWIQKKVEALPKKLIIQIHSLKEAKGFLLPTREMHSSHKFLDNAISKDYTKFQIPNFFPPIFSLSHCECPNLRCNHLK